MINDIVLIAPILYIMLTLIITRDEQNDNKQTVFNEYKKQPYEN